MMTKERFVYLIDFIKRHRELENNLCRSFEQLCPGEYCNTFVFSEYEYELLKTIKDALSINYDDDILEYFTCDLEFGTAYKKGDLVVDGVDIDISTAENLYDYLVKNN